MSRLEDVGRAALEWADAVDARNAARKTFRGAYSDALDRISADESLLNQTVGPDEFTDAHQAARRMTDELYRTRLAAVNAMNGKRCRLMHFVKLARAAAPETEEIPT